MRAHHSLSSYVSYLQWQWQDLGRYVWETCLPHFYMHPLAISTSTFGHQRSTTFPKRAMYGLRSSPKAWQDYFATKHVRSGFPTSTFRSKTSTRTAPATLTSWSTSMTSWSLEILQVKRIFEKIQEKMLLKHTGYLDPGEKHYFLGRQVHNERNYFDIKLDDDYIEAILQEVNMTKCNPAPYTSSSKQIYICRLRTSYTGPTQGLQKSSRKATVAFLDQTGHILLNQGIGQRTTSTDRSGLEEGKTSNKIDIRGTSNYTQQLRPTTTLNTSKGILDMDVHVDADWAGCLSTRKSTTGFVIYILGTPISFGSRTQAIIALSSAESELYAICTGTSEGLHLKMFLQESGLTSKVNIRIHTDSTAGKSIATRQGTSKKAKHIDIRFLYTQQLTRDGIISIHTNNTTCNTADILTKYISRKTLQRLLYAAGLHARA